MPIYEYRCEQCGIFEEMRRITDPSLERCPKCRRKVQRLISSTSFQLKGSGWYVTDYARAGSGNGREKKADAPEAAAGSTGASDSAAESKGTTSADSGGTPAKTGS